jgi:hypothetical protein
LIFYHRCRANLDPAELLRPENQRSTPWGSPNFGSCDKCGGSGETEFRCYSCLESPDAGCLACHGEPSASIRCPACEGEGEISRVERIGVSVFPSPIGLYRYIAERDEALEGCSVIELEGDLSGDVDLDADVGALLIYPTKVVGRHDLNLKQIESLRSHLQGHDP